MKRTFIMVLDSFGIGAAHDAHKFGDEGSNTLGHIADACARGEADIGRKGPLHLPNLTKLGLGKAGEESSGSFPAGLDPNAEIIGAYGLCERNFFRQRYAIRPLGNRRCSCVIRLGIFF